MTFTEFQQDLNQQPLSQLTEIKVNRCKKKCIKFKHFIIQKEEILLNKNTINWR